jgi:hypothetical protein
MSMESVKQLAQKSEGLDSRVELGGQPRTPRPALQYVDRSDCNETFADSISRLSFDGQTLRIEFAVSRFRETNADNQVSGRLYPACRLVLTPSAAADLMQKLQQVAAALARARIQNTQSQPSNGSDKKTP